MSNLVQGMKICTAFEPSRDPSGGVNSEGIDLRNAHMVYVVVQLDQSGADQITATLQQSEGTNWEALVNTVPRWVNNDTDANDTLVRQTNAVSYQTTVDVNPKMVVFQVDPAKLDDENATSGDPNYALRVRLTGGAAGDTYSAMFVVVPTRYKGATVPEVRL